MEPENTGACLCGGVTLTVRGALGAPVACHCVQCRKQTGHYLVSTEIKKANLTVTGPVRWFQSSEKVRRGFCPTCGSVLFWDPIHHDWLGVAMGVFDGPTGVTLAQHIFVSQQGDYYTLTDGLPQNAR